MAFWTNFGPFSGPLLSPKQFFFKKKSFKGTLMAITILFGGNLWKMFQQIGVILLELQFWANLGSFWSPWEPHPAEKKIFKWKF